MAQKTLNIEEKLNVSYCIPLSLRDEQIRINLQKVKGRVENNPELIKEPIAIVAFAPSLNQTWEQIKNFKYIMTCSGAHKFLVERGIIPTHHVDLDPRIHKLKLLGQPQKETEYLIASTIHPQYLDTLEGYNVKLWHIFANEDDGARILPRGEWSLTGGSSVGLRCLTLARFLGFNNMHIFGMDGSFIEGNTHSAEHPNAPKESYETEYKGKKFLTTPSMLHVAKETFHELDEMPDCTFTFYGDGLVQEMAKDYKPSSRHKATIAFNKPELISKEYIELNKKLHQDNPSYGMGGDKHATAVLKLSEVNKTTDILDYGAGKMMLQKALPFPIFNYDPAVPEIAKYPRPATIVVATDVLEHIEPDKLMFVLDDLKFLIKKVGYFVISTRKAAKTYANGKNAHLIVKDKDWWKKQLEKYFEVALLPEKKKDEAEFVVGPKVAKLPDMEVVEKDGMTVKFLTPNDTTKWRAKSIFTKEPSTVEWIMGMKEGDVFFDIGANVGSYSVLAGAKKLKVYSFEPEAENYALLIKNLQLNDIEANAYCLAISDTEKTGTLYMSQPEAGAACHSFNESVGHDLHHRKSKWTQGCFGIPLDTLIEKGLPSPQHIKVDVDGFEYKVIKGATKTLMNGVQSLLVEINPSIPEHQEMLKYIQSLGFEYDKAQVEKAERKEGTFKGVAEYVFRKIGMDQCDQITSPYGISIVSAAWNQVSSLSQQISVPSRVRIIDQCDQMSAVQSNSTTISANIGSISLLISSMYAPEEDIARRIENAAIELEPFNYMYVDGIFPNYEYKKIIENMPRNYVEIEKSRGTKGYPKRFTADPLQDKLSWVLDVWNPIYEKILNGKMKKALLKKFGIKDEGFVEDILLVRDEPGYSIPPHTDSLRKVITVLIYLPEDDSIKDEGTTIFVPKKKGFTCKTGQHYKFEDFKAVKTLPFKPNSMFAFARTDNSFHGVFPSKHVRNVLLYNINRK